MADSLAGTLFFAAIAVGIAWVIGNSKSDSRIADERRAFEIDFKAKELLLQNKEASLQAANKLVAAKLDKLEYSRIALKDSLGAGRKWLAEMITEAEVNSDRGLENYLKYKKRPAPSAAENVKAISAEKKYWMQKAKEYEYQIKQLEEYFPILSEYREAILEEMVSVTALTDKDGANDIDPVLSYVTKLEWDKLMPIEREQLALTRYIEGSAKSSWDAGLRYERYLGYLYEKQGWSVEYVGAIKGFEDFGRDLICTKAGEVYVVQAKRWKNLHSL